uniref:Uncharacterized protein n=1 Tax=Arundo donax TaxID=35708 RepID=A0A0A9CG50_ARUDO
MVTSHLTILVRSHALWEVRISHLIRLKPCNYLEAGSGYGHQEKTWEAVSSNSRSGNPCVYMTSNHLKSRDSL